MSKYAVRCAAFVCVAAGLALSAQAQPKLTLSQDSWDFGEAWHGANPSLDLVLKNEGTEDLRLTRVKAC